MKSNKEVSCPYCLSVKVVKNGIKSSGAQNLRCKGCSKQFQEMYVYQGCNQQTKGLLLRMLLRGSGVRDCAEILGIGKTTVLKYILRRGLNLEIKPKKKHYEQVQIDELWSYVGNKEKKVWLLYAYCAKSKEILAFAMGKRNVKTLKSLLLRLKQVTIDYFCTDHWEAFKAVLPREKHLIGKEFTKAIEGMNTWLRTRLRRLNRRTTCFSKKLKYYYSMLKLLIQSKKYPSYS